MPRRSRADRAPPSPPPPWRRKSASPAGRPSRRSGTRSARGRGKPHAPPRTSLDLDLDRRMVGKQERTEPPPVHGPPVIVAHLGAPDEDVVDPRTGGREAREPAEHLRA